MFSKSLILAAALVLVSCATAPTPQPTFDGPFDVRGTWKYTVIDGHKNAYDYGTITFAGDETTGTWKQSNAYQIEYQGSWELTGTSLALAGDESWGGKAVSANEMAGTWAHPDASGTWKAVR